MTAPWEKNETIQPSTPPVQVQEERAEVQAAGTDAVIVGCKLPNGILIELIPKHEGWNPPPAGKRVKLNGANTAKREMLIRVNPRILDYGKTTVNKSFWEQWLTVNKDNPLVTNGFIFAEEKPADFRAHARDTLGARVGLEGLNPEGNDERIKKIQLPGHAETKVETDKEHLKRLQENMEQVG